MIELIAQTKRLGNYKREKNKQTKNKKSDLLLA